LSGTLRNFDSPHAKIAPVSAALSRHRASIRHRFNIEINNYKEIILKLRNPARALVAVSALTSLFALTACQKADNAGSSNDGDTIKIGFITDMSGVYADVDGPAGAEAIKMAIADFGGNVNGKKIEFVSADHQNKADIAASKAREWFDQQGVDMLIGGTNSATSLAMAVTGT
jgi:branched-chain amino acid transport system substrate-binding protein